MTTPRGPVVWMAFLAWGVALCGPGAAQPPDEADLYVPRDTWQQSLHDSLLRLAELEEAEKVAARGPSTVTLGPWHLIGPFSNKDGKGFAKAYAPEKNVALGASYADITGKPTRWRPMEGFLDGRVHSLLPHFDTTEWAIAYLYRRIQAQERTALKASFGSDDGLAVWLNGAKLISQDVPRGPAPDQALTTLNLKPGDNHLLLKIVNRTGGWGFYFKANEEPFELNPWHIIGSFDNAEGKGFAKAYPPEKEIALDKTYPGVKGTKAAWRHAPQLADGKVQQLRAHFKHTEWAIAYLHRTITARKPIEIKGYFGSDDGLAVWLNQEKLISKDVPRGSGPDQDTASLKLKQGRNDLLLKIVNRTGGWGYYFSTEPGGGEPGENATHKRRVDAIWERVRRQFTTPEDERQMKDELADGIWPAGWHPKDGASLARRYRDATTRHTTTLRELVEGLKTDLGPDAVAPEQAALDTLSAPGVTPTAAPEREAIDSARGAYHRAARGRDTLRGIAWLVSTRMAIDDLAATYPDDYPRAGELRTRCQALRWRARRLLSDATRGNPGGAEALASWHDEIIRLQQEALITTNPLLGFGGLLFITRKPGGGNPGLPQNWQGNSSMRRTGWDTSINVLSPVGLQGQVRALHHSDKYFVGDLELSYDAERILFSMPAETKSNRYQVWEIGSDGDALRMVTRDADDDYDNYDACYLPDGKIMFTSTRCYQAVPCTGGDHVSLMYVMDADGGNVRQLTFDQDHSWNPTMLNDGRVIYTRWEYNDTPHYFSRILFTMNPDGTRQMAFYGTNSFFPNTMMYARPIPGSNTRVSCILSGHHGNPRMGEVAIIDSAIGEREADGVLRILPQRHRKIEPVIVDQYATGTWPQFVQPYPLSDKYFLVSCKPAPDAWWGLYLVDVFDNLVPLRIEPGAALMEPIPLRPRKTPQVIPNGVNLAREDALVYLYDVYRGAGLEGVPRGSVKKLRLIEPIYRYWGNGQTHSVAVDGTWDVKRILGTVPVQEDGSALFRVPANTPIMVQPLNAENMAQQQMRSWLTAMPGEVLSCVGCHERRLHVPSGGVRAQAQKRRPSEIAPWYGPPRGFAFEAEVQPVLDRHCVKCHSKAPVDLRPSGAPGAKPTRFSPAYDSLHPYVRRPGLEADIRMLPPREFEAGTSKLVQMLKKGHFGVKLGPEDWDRLITWIDLNVPFAGDWRDGYPAAPEHLIRRREEIRARDAAVIARQRQVASN